MIHDRFDRPLRSLRISVTDRCNLRCQYCMPEADYAWLPRESILDFEEIAVLADAFTSLGVDRVRLTGGEPLLRRDLPRLVELLAARPAIRDLALTTNGVLLAGQAGALRAAGLHRLTISLDTLRRDRFQALARFDELPAVLAGIDAAARAGFAALKIDTVVLRGRNDDELQPLLEFGRTVGAEVRFIEYMDVGGATALVDGRGRVAGGRSWRGWRRSTAPSRPLPGRDSAPAERFRLPDGTTFGIIASTTEPFCAACDRSRLTADGLWLLCLYARGGLDLRHPLREGATREELAHLISTVWSMRADRGAEERLGIAGARGADPGRGAQARRAPRDAHARRVVRAVAGGSELMGDLEPPYSDRSATIGSTRVARRAGTKLATIPTTASTATMAASVAGSRGETSNSMLLHHRTERKRGADADDEPGADQHHRLPGHHAEHVARAWRRAPCGRRSPAFAAPPSTRPRRRSRSSRAAAPGRPGRPAASRSAAAVRCSAPGRSSSSARRRSGCRDRWPRPRA